MKPPTLARRAAGLGIRVLFLAALVCVATFLYLKSDDATERLRLALIRAGSERLGEDLYVRELRIEGLLPPSAVLREVSVHGSGGLPLANVDEVRITLAGLPLPWRRVVAISSLVALRPALRVALDEGQPRDFRELVRSLEGPRPPGAGRWKVQIGSVDVEGVSARVTMEPSGLGLAVDGLDVAFSQDERGDGCGTVAAASVDLQVGQISQHAALDQARFDVAAGVVTLDRSVVALQTGVVELSGVVELPDPAGAPAARPLRYGLTARAGIELARLREAWPKLPAMDGTVDAAIGLSGEGAAPRVTFNLQGEGIAVHWVALRPLTFKGESPSLIGYFEDGRVVLEPESALHWGGGVIRPVGWFDLRGEMPFDVDLVLEDTQIERILDSATVPGSFVTMEMNGTGHLAGHARGGFIARGASHIDVRDMIVSDDDWDAPHPRREVLRVPRAAVDAGITITSSHLVLEPATVRGPGTLLDVACDFLFQRPLGLVISVDSRRFDMADIDGRIAGVPFGGRGSVEAFVEGPSRDVDIRGSVELDDFVLGKWPFGRVGGDVHWHARRDLELTSLRGHRGQTDFESEVRVMFADVRRGGTREKVELAVDVVVPEKHGRAEDLLPVFFGDAIGATGDAWGKVVLRGRPGALDGWGQVSAREVGYLWETWESLDARAQVRAGRLTIEDAFARKPSGEALFARGSIERGGEVEFEFRLPGMDIGQLDPVRRLVPERPATGIQDLPGATGPWAGGRVSGNARVGGSLKNITLDGRLRLDDLVYRGTRMGSSEAEFRIRDHSLVVDGRGLDGKLSGKAVLRTNGLADYQYGVRWEDLDLTPFLPRTILAQTEPVRAGTSGQVEGVGTLADSFSDVTLSLRDLWLERGRHRMQARPGRPLSLRYDRGALRMEHVEMVSPPGGDGVTDLRVEGWIRPDGPLKVSIDGTVDVAFADLAYDVFDRAEAQVLVLDVDVSGMSARAVDIEGTAELKGALLKTVYWPHPLEIEWARVELRDRRLVLTGLRGSMGGGRIEDAAGSFMVLDRTGYRPRDYSLKARCVGCTVRFPSFMPPATGTADLQFTGTAPDRLLLSGRVTLDEMVLRDPLNWQRSVLTFSRKYTETLARADRPALFGIDLAFDSAPGALGMRNNVGLLAGSTSGFRVQGDTNHVGLQGRVTLESGTIPFSGHPFEIEPGSEARFEDPGSWFPALEVRMSTDVDSRDETYRITYVVTGPLNSPKLEARSEPMMTEADINLLLLFGLTQEQLAEADLRDVLLAGAGAAGGTYGETAATSAGQAAMEAGAADWLVPDRVEIVPVYTDTTGATTVWAVLTWQLPKPADMVTVEAGFGLFTTSRMNQWPAVVRAQLRFQRNVYLEGSWLMDDEASRSYGNFGLDLKFGVEAE